MPEGISPNPLNDLSKVYLDQVAAFREIRKQETEKDIERWSQSAKDVQKEGYKGTADLSKADPEAKKKVEDRIEKWAGKRVPGGKKGVKESFSNWRTDLREISDAIPETEKKTEKEVTEKKVKNKIEINPKISEAVAEIGGEVLSVEEQTAPVEEDPSIKAKEKRQAMIKKQVLNKKLQAVRMGAGADITASYDPIEAAAEYFYEEGINEEGIDLLIEEIGLDEFVEFVSDDVELLNEQRAARKASVRAKKYPQVKAEVDKADAARKAAKKGEYAPSYAKKETDVTVYDDKAPAKKKAAAKKAPAGMKKAVARKKAVLQQPVKKTAPKPKVVKAVAKVKKTQPAKKPSKQGLVSKISTAYKKGLERHKAARAKGRVPEKRVKEFGKGFASGVKDTVKFAKKAKKAVVGEAKIDDVKNSKSEKLKDHSKDVHLTHANPGVRQDRNKRRSASDVIFHGHSKVERDRKQAHYKSRGVKTKGVKEAVVGEEIIDERLGGKGYSRKAAGSGIHKTSGDWPDSDRGAGNKAKRRSGGEVKAKSPTYLAHVHNKKIKEDKALEMVRSAIIKKHGKGAIYDPKNPPKSSPQPKRKPEKDTRSAAQREVDAQYGRTPWNKKGSLGT